MRLENFSGLLFLKKMLPNKKHLRPVYAVNL